VNLEKVVFGFFIILAMTLNFGYFIGDPTDPDQHDVMEMFAAIVVNLVATVLKFGDRTQIGAIQLASSLVALLQLVAAAIVWMVVVYGTGTGLTPANMSRIVSLAGGALLANIVSVAILVVETVMLRR
jgi:hypothetical protein